MAIKVARCNNILHGLLFLRAHNQRRIRIILNYISRIMCVLVVLNSPGC